MSVFSMDPIRGFWDYMEVAIPNYIMIAFSRIGGELTMIMAGYITVTATSAYSVMLTIATVCFRVSMAFMYMASVYVG